MITQLRHISKQALQQHAYQRSHISKNWIKHNNSLLANSGIIYSHQFAFGQQKSVVVSRHFTSPSEYDKHIDQLENKVHTSKTLKDAEKHIKKEGQQFIQEVKQRHKGDHEKLKEQFLATPGFLPKTKLIYRFAVDLGHKFWQGTKELYRNTKEAYSLSRKRSYGITLTRKEQRFIRQNRQDLKNLVPFFLVWRIPIFGDFILPFFIAKYPELLPSTFQLARRPTLEELIKNAQLKQLSLLAHIPVQDETMLKRIQQLHLTFEKGNSVVTYERVEQYKEVLEYHFGDCKSLDGRQIAAILSRLSLGTRAPSFWLVKKLETHMEYLTSDDKIIHQEKVESLSFADLRQACLERGLKVIDMGQVELQQQLREWIRISMHLPHIKLCLLIYAHGWEVRDLIVLPERAHPDIDHTHTQE